MKLPPTLYAVGANITWTQLSSASKKEQVAVKFLQNNSSNKLTGSLFKIKTKKGKDISHFSLFPDEEEVLFKFNTFFKVMSKLENVEGKEDALPDLAGYNLSNLDVYVSCSRSCRRRC